MKSDGAAALKVSPGSLRVPVPRARPTRSRALSDFAAGRILAARAGVYLLCFFDNAQHTFGAEIYGVSLGFALLCWTRASSALVRIFLPLWLMTGLYVFLSYAHVLPPAWTVFYDMRALRSQASWVFGLPLMANLSVAYATSVLRFHGWREFKIISGLLILNFFASGFLSSDHYSILSYGPFGYLWAPMSIYLMVVAWGVQIQPSIAVKAVFLLQALPAITLADGTQTKIAYAVVVVTLLFGEFKQRVAGVALFGVIAFIVVGYYYTLNNAYEVYQRSPDTGIRAMMLKNAYLAAEQSGFIGVGFGTESLQNVYPEVEVTSFAWIDDSFILIGNHNAFMEVLMRMGAPGLLCLLYTFLRLAPPFGGGWDAATSFRQIMLAIVILNLSINVGLQSPFHMAGAGIMLGAAFAVRNRNLIGNDSLQFGAAAAYGGHRIVHRH